PNASAISAGGDHTCALDTAGVAWCWGANSSRQLGDGTAMDRATPARVTAATAPTSIVAGWSHPCVIAAGSVVCWGANGSGQLGNGTTTGTGPSTATPLSNADALSLGSSTSCAHATDGTAWCWGDNSRGQIGDGTMMLRTMPTRAALQLGPVTA